MLKIYKHYNNWYQQDEIDINRMKEIFVFVYNMCKTITFENIERFGATCDSEKRFVRILHICARNAGE